MGLLGVVIAKKRSGQSDEDIKADLKRSVRSWLLSKHACVHGLQDQQASDILDLLDILDILSK